MKLKNFLKAGLAAGVTVNVLGAVLVPVLGNQMDDILAARNVPALSYGATAYFAMMSLLLGGVLVWICVLLRDRFSSVWMTVIAVSFAVWFLTYFWSNAALVAYGFVPLSFAVVGTAWGFMELLIAGFVGAWVYGDDS